MYFGVRNATNLKMMALFPAIRNPLLSLFQSAAASVARRRSVACTDITAHPLTAAAAYIAVSGSNPTKAYPSPANTAVPAMAMTCAGLGPELLEAW
jgi:hypothetical protein